MVHPDSGLHQCSCWAAMLNSVSLADDIAKTSSLRPRFAQTLARVATLMAKLASNHWESGQLSSRGCNWRQNCWLRTLF